MASYRGKMGSVEYEVIEAQTIATATTEVSHNLGSGIIKAMVVPTSQYHVWVSAEDGTKITLDSENDAATCDVWVFRLPG